MAGYSTSFLFVIFILPCLPTLIHTVDIKHECKNTGTVTEVCFYKKYHRDQNLGYQDVFMYEES